MFRASLRCFEVFIAVHEAGSFSAASEILNIAQPSVSSHIGALERSVGGQVFERRRGSRPKLTQLGVSVLHHARQMMTQADDLKLDILNLQASADQRVTLSCQRSLANFTLNRALTSFVLAHPKIQLAVRIGTQEDVLNDVRHRRADIGCFLSNENQRGLNSHPIGHQSLHLIASKNHRLANTKLIKPERIASESFVGPPVESHFGRSINKLLFKIGIKDFKIVAQATEYQFIRELVVAGVGIACSPSSSVQLDVSSGRLVVLDLDADPLRIEIRLLTSPHVPETRAMKQLRDYLIKEIKRDNP
tara:strand:+ start:3362 stop:4273 length:912 start_codon:yes stop_codon:yes gene_type:complete